MRRLNDGGILLHNLTGEAILIKGCTAQPDEYFVVTELVGQNLQANYGDKLPTVDLAIEELESLHVFTAYTKEALELALDTVFEDEENDEPEIEPVADSATGQGEEAEVDAQETNPEITVEEVSPADTFDGASDFGLLLPPLEDDAPETGSYTDLLGTEDATPSVLGVTVTTNENVPEDVVVLTDGAEVVATITNVGTEEATEPEEVTPTAPRRGRPPRNNS